MSKVKLTDVCEITTGKLDSNAFDEKGLYPFFTCSPDPLRINTYAFDGDVILLAGNNASGNFHCNRYNGKFNAYQRTYVIAAKNGYDIDYIFYNLKINLAHLKKIAQGSQTKFLTMKILDNFMLEDIPLIEQKKLSSILRFIDSKISNNNRINAELESMAKTIYDYWFTQFDFPDENGKPYKSSGGKMVWNEELKREIPEGWEVGTLSDIAKITMGSSPKGESLNENKEGIIFYQGKTDFGDRFPTERVYTTSPIRYAEENDVLLSVRAPVGSINIANEKCCIGRGLASIHSKYQSFVFYLLLANQFQFDKFNQAGTTFGAATKDDVFGLKCIIPNDSIMLAFEKAVQTLDNKIRNNAKENQQLASLRDWLLPMLMNGQVGFEEE